MDNKNIDDFYKVFDHVGLNKDQVLKFSEQPSFNDELCKYNDNINNAAYNAVESIKNNLWGLAKDDRELYFKKIIRDTHFATKGIIKNVAITNEYQNGNLDRDNADTFSLYVIKCWFYLHQFKQSLDVISADFNVDIFKIQNEISITFIEKRYIDALYYYGYNELFEVKELTDDKEETFKFTALKAKESLSATESGIKYSYLYKADIKPFSTMTVMEAAKHFAEESGKNITNIAAAIRATPTANKKQLQNVLNSLVDYPEVQKAIENDIEILS